MAAAMHFCGSSNTNTNNINSSSSSNCRFYYQQQQHNQQKQQDQRNSYAGAFINHNNEKQNNSEDTNNNNNNNNANNNNNNNNNSKSNKTYENHTKCNNSKMYNKYNNKNNTISAKMSQRCQMQQMYAAFCTILVILFSSAALVQTASVSPLSNVDMLTNPNFKQLCSAQHEHFIESDGKESSVILEFKPNAIEGKKKSCTRILSAPAEYGFIVRLILPKLRHHHQQSQSQQQQQQQQQQHQQSQMMESAAVDAIPPPAQHSTVEPNKSSTSTLNEMTSLIEKLNTTALKSLHGRTCPLSIFSSLDPHTPQWRVDPCQLEDTAPEMEDPVRLFHGRVRIVWEHGQHTLKSKLMVTALGKGEQCRGDEKHQCLRIGNEPLLCISKDLVCDGIRHCPYSNEYDSDEDYGMCWKHRRTGDPLPSAMDSDIFEQFALEVFRNLFAYDSPSTDQQASTTMPNLNDDGDRVSMGDGGDRDMDGPLLVAVNRTTLRKVNTKEMSTSGNDSQVTYEVNETDPKVENNTDSGLGGGFHRRNSTRSGLHSDLSKYGPWGYLMLGMLLCGGALLICGLWASASQHAVNNEREAALAAAAANGGMDPTSVTAPPNYEELDPPPAYSVLFPNQKAASSNTLNALDAAATPTLTSPSATSSGNSAAVTISMTHAQLEQTASGSGGSSSSVNNGQHQDI